MSHTHDITYEYSLYLLWDLVETTSAILVFCVPAIPIAFRGGVSPRFHIWLRSKMKRRKGQDILPDNDERRHWPREFHTLHPTREHHVVAGSNELRLAEQQPSRTSSRDDVDEQGIAGLIQMGILRTTEIEIITHEGCDSGASSTHHGTIMYPWSETS